jgi:hypothetical protein
MFESKTLITIELGPAGVTRIVSRPRTVAEAAECNRLLAATVLPLRLLHDTVRELNHEAIEDLPSPERA